MAEVDSSNSSTPPSPQNSHEDQEDQQQVTPKRIEKLKHAKKSSDGAASIKSITASTEEELLAKLDEQNRLLEADVKSLKTLQDSGKSSSWRGSNASLQSNSSNTSNLSNAIGSTGEGVEPMSVQDQWLIWGKIVNDWEEYSKRKARQLKDLVRLGVPHHFRGIVWQLLCNAYKSPLKDQYCEYLKMNSTCEKIIRRDIARTFPEHEFFKEKDGLGQETLFNVMKAYSLHDKEVGYCQGSAFIVGLLLMQMPEEEAFCVLVKLMQEYRLRELFKPSMAELGLCMYQFECLVQDLLPEMFKHFMTQSFHTSMYASSWFLTVFATCLPLSLACRVMDVFIFEGMEVIFRVGMAILQLNYNILINMDMEDMLRFLQREAPKIHAEEPDLLILTAFQVKYNAKKMKKLEKEYLAIKTKENEDQIEMRRLRTENRLLRQRIDNLEKENEVIADKLIQGQLSRAQEAEEHYAIRKQLEQTKHSNEEIAKKYEGAQSVIKDLRERARHETNNTALDKEAESIIMVLQEELIAVRLREAETAETLQGLTKKIKSLEELNKKTKDDPGHSIESLQDELIAVKLREAEANLSLKELRLTVNDLESQWQKQLQRSSSRKQGSSKPTIQALTEELMTVRLREAEAAAELKEVRQRVMELQTQNQMTSNQMRRIEEERLQLKAELEVSDKKKDELQSQMYGAQKELCNLNARTQEDKINVRLREMELNASMIELQQRISGLELKNQELLTKNTLDGTEINHNVQELHNKIYELQREVTHLRRKSGDLGLGDEFASTPLEPRMVIEDFDDGLVEDQKIDLSAIESDNDMLES